MPINRSSLSLLFCCFQGERCDWIVLCLRITNHSIGRTLRHLNGFGYFCQTNSFLDWINMNTLYLCLLKARAQQGTKRDFFTLKRNSIVHILMGGKVIMKLPARHCVSASIYTGGIGTEQGGSGRRAEVNGTLHLARAGDGVLGLLQIPQVGNSPHHF